MRKSLHEEDQARRRCVIMSDIREDVRKKYAAAISARSGHACCGGREGCGTGSGSGCDAITGGNYFPEDLPDLLQNMEIPTFGCGNPTAIASLRPGETVLDLGSGAGLDVLLAAVKVGPTGRVYGLDMTEEMLSEAERNRRRAGLENVTFLKGHMEEIPLPDESVDLVISNCVVNLSPDKDRVLAEVFRVLRRGGRVAISDVVLLRAFPPAVHRSVAAWTGCIAGALSAEEFERKIRRAGFDGGDVRITKVYSFSPEEARELFPDLSPEELSMVDGAAGSALVTARKGTGGAPS